MTTVAEFMTVRPLTLDASSTVCDAARQMRDADIGDVIVTEGGEVRGIITDRDITVRAIAAEMDPKTTTLDQVLTEEQAGLPVNCKLPRALRQSASAFEPPAAVKG